MQMQLFTQLHNFCPWKPAVQEFNHGRDSPTILLGDSMAKNLSMHLINTFQHCNPSFSYDPSKNPTRPLTNPCEGVSNNGFDNIENDYIVHMNEIILSPEGRQYKALDFLGKGSFGQVIKCRKSGEEVCAAKIIKNKPAYFYQGLIEVKTLDKLNKLDPNDECRIVRKIDFFIYRKHLIIIIELLGCSVYDLLRQNRYHGFSMTLIRHMTQQLLQAMCVFRKARIIHCDLKPENILLKTRKADIKVIDFGSACFENATIYSYIQSRYYRSPEIILGRPYGPEIDIWSLGCIAAELFIGIPLFPGNSDYDQIYRIIDFLGLPKQQWLDGCKQRDKYFVLEGGGYRLKTREEFMASEGVRLDPSKKWIELSKIDNLMQLDPVRRGTEEEMKKEQSVRLAFQDFLKGLLQVNPEDRWTPDQAAAHPFILNIEMREPFVPPPSNIDSGRIEAEAVPRPTEARQGSCPDVRRHMSTGFTSEQISYRPSVQELPDDFFKGFPHGKLAVFAEEKKQQVPMPLIPNPDMSRLTRPFVGPTGPAVGPVPGIHNTPLIRGPRLQRPLSDTIKQSPTDAVPKPKPKPSVKRAGSGTFVTKSKESRRTNSDPDKEKKVPMPPLDFPSQFPPGMIPEAGRRKLHRSEEPKDPPGNS